MRDTDGRCARPGCDNTAEMDWPGITFNEDMSAIHCSPDCAREALHERSPGEFPVTITLLDPQFAVDRSELPGVDHDEPTMNTEAHSAGESFDVIDDIETMFPGEFRPTEADR